MEQRESTESRRQAQNRDKRARRKAGMMDELTSFFRKTLTGDDHASVRDFVRKAFRKRLVGDEGRSIRGTMWNTFQREDVVLLRDKISFFLGVVNLLVAELVLVQFPDYFPWLFSFWFPTLMALRLYYYSEAHYEFFLIDYCYFVNFIGLVHVWIAPESPFVFGMFYAAATGPVCVAILAWRNALVFHSLDKLTTLFIHSFPAMLAFSQRWLANTTHSRICRDGEAEYRPGDGMLWGTVYLFPGEQQVLGGEAGQMETCAPPHSAMALMISGLAYYAFWQAIYLFITEVVFSTYLNQHPEELTSMRYFIERGQKTALYRLVTSAMASMGCMKRGEQLKLGEARTLITFVLSQLLYTIITMLPPLLFQGNIWLSSLWLLAIGLNAVWNGSTYYIQIFSRRYAENFSEMFVKQGKGRRDRIVEEGAAQGSKAKGKGKGKEAEKPKGEADGDGSSADGSSVTSAGDRDGASTISHSSSSAAGPTERRDDGGDGADDSLSGARSEVSSVGSGSAGAREEDAADRAYRRAFVMGMAAAAVMQENQGDASGDDGTPSLSGASSPEGAN